MIALAVATGIAPDVWLDWGPRAMSTAIDLLERRARAMNGERDDEVMGG